MSRAFVNEDASTADESEAPEIKIPIPPGSRNYMTAAGAEALSRELHDLTGRERPGLLAELAAQSAPGRSPAPDELSAIRRRLGEIDRRIAYLDAMAGIAEIVTPPPPDARDRVSFGVRVQVRDPEGVESSYQIVGVDEADPQRGLVGWPSPVARALMGRRVGDRAVVKLPVGERTLIIVRIE